MDPFKTFDSILSPLLKDGSLKDLKKRWTEPHRYYHNKSHLEGIILELQKNIWFNDLGYLDKRVLLLAAFYHDAIYDPKRTDNEEQSEKLFKKHIKHPDSFISDEVVECIKSTKWRSRPSHQLVRIFWEADNAGFLKGYNHLLKNEGLIRKEYSFVSRDVYKKKRIQFLKTNLGLFSAKADKDILKLIEFVEKY